MTDTIEGPLTVQGFEGDLYLSDLDIVMATDAPALTITLCRLTGLNFDNVTIWQPGDGPALAIVYNLFDGLQFEFPHPGITILRPVGN